MCDVGGADVSGYSCKQRSIIYACTCEMCLCVLDRGMSACTGYGTLTSKIRDGETQLSQYKDVFDCLAAARVGFLEAQDYAQEHLRKKAKRELKSVS